MNRKTPEPLHVVKQRRDDALNALADSIPYIQFLGVEFDRHGDELTAVMRYSEHLVGNPSLPALHGGATAAFMESAAMIELAWRYFWEDIENGVLGAGEEDQVTQIRVPRTIDFSVDYLRSGLPRDAYARARINRYGRRYASVQVEAWQDHKDRLFAQATGHFLMPSRNDA
ncbi:MAG: PaaI family thioesterase [Pseudoruegeria sp.]